MIVLPQEYRARTLPTNTIWELPVSSDRARTSFGLEVNPTYTKTETEWESIFPCCCLDSSSNSGDAFKNSLSLPISSSYSTISYTCYSFDNCLLLKGSQTIFMWSLDLNMCFIILSESHNLCETLSSLQSLKYLCLPIIVKCWWSSRYSWICYDM